MNKIQITGFQLAVFGIFSLNVNLLAQGKLGEVILNATLQFKKGSDGDLQDLIEALSTLRHIGLDATARRATLSLIKLGY